MNTGEIEYSRDDMVVLGKISSMAVMRGFGEQALPILKVMQKTSPHNAAAFLLEAMYLYSVGASAEAIALLEESDVFQASLNRDEAAAFHLFLLQQDGQIERTLELGQAYLDDGTFVSGQALEAIRIVVTEARAMLGRGSATNVGSDGAFGQPDGQDWTGATA